MEENKPSRCSSSQPQSDTRATVPPLPISMEYYQTLGVTHYATPAQLKKKYYELAMKYHPDKNSDPQAAEQFKKISQAYQVLSDPDLRHKYDQVGPGGNSNPEAGFRNPEEYFQQQFGGGDLFVDIIGQLHIGKMAGRLTQTTNSRSIELNPNQERLLFESRVTKLARNLVDKLSLYTDAIEAGNNSDTIEQNFRLKMMEEAEELKVQTFGLPLLRSIGYMYSSKADKYLSGKDYWGMSGVCQDLKITYRRVGNVLSFASQVIGLSTASLELNESQRRSGATSEDQEKIKDELGRKALNCLAEMSKMEVEKVIGSVCDKILDPSLGQELLKKRANSLKIIGDVYQDADEDFEILNVTESYL